MIKRGSIREQKRCYLHPNILSPKPTLEIIKRLHKPRKSALDHRPIVDN
jgi:hypothetical protein